MSTILTWEDDSGAVVSAEFDCDLQETHELTNVVTEHPVETGADVADHIAVQLPRFTVEGYVSDTPLLSNPGVVDRAEFKQIELQIPEQPQKIGLSQAIGAAVGAIGDLLTGGPKPLRATMLRFEDMPSRKRAAFELFEDVRLNARLVRVITSLHEYENMALEQFTATRSPDDGNGATFTIALKQLEFVTSDITVAPEPAEISGQLKKSAGAKNAKTDAEKISEIKKSVLARAVDGAAAFFDTGF